MYTPKANVSSNSIFIQQKNIYICSRVKYLIPYKCDEKNKYYYNYYILCMTGIEISIERLMSFISNKEY